MWTAKAFRRVFKILEFTSIFDFINRIDYIFTNFPGKFFLKSSSTLICTLKCDLLSSKMTLAMPTLKVRELWNKWPGVVTFLHGLFFDSRHTTEEENRPIGALPGKETACW